MEIMQYKFYSYKWKKGNQIQKFITILAHRFKSQIQQREYRINVMMPLCVLNQISGRKKKGYIFIGLDKKIPTDITRQKQLGVCLSYLK